MRRSTLIEAAKSVAAAIENSSLIETIRGDGKNAGPILSALNSYTISANSFTKEAREIAEIFNLSILTDPSNWTELLEGAITPAKRSLQSNLISAQRTLPRLLSLMTQDHPDAPMEKSIDATATNNELSLLRVVLVEEDAHFSTARRVIDALDACQELYTSLAALYDFHSVPLAIGAIDSGSDKSFDLFGAAELIKQLNQLILTIWDLVVFHKERKAGRSFELIANSLPILAEISQLESEGKLGREQAEIIRRGIIDGATKFLGTGTITEEMERTSIVNPRVLMAPEPRLLTGPELVQSSPSREKESEIKNQMGRSDIANLSDDDLLRLANLLKDKEKQKNIEENGSDATDLS